MRFVARPLSGMSRGDSGDSECDLDAPVHKATIPHEAHSGFPVLLFLAGALGYFSFNWFWHNNCFILTGCVSWEGTGPVLSLQGPVSPTA